MGFDRRQKSFGEPTRVRADGSRAEPQNDVPRGKPASAAYEKYKQDLAAFFNGDKPLPTHMKELLATRPGAAEHGMASDEPVAVAPKAAVVEEPRAIDKKRRVASRPGEDMQVLVDAIRKASSPREVTGAVDALKAKGGSLPFDAEVLSKALGHGNEDILTEALRGLCGIATSEIKSPTLLKTRIKNVALLASSSELRELCQQLQSRLA